MLVLGVDLRSNLDPTVQILAVKSRTHPIDAVPRAHRLFASEDEGRFRALQRSDEVDYRSSVQCRREQIRRGEHKHGKWPDVRAVVSLQIAHDVQPQWTTACEFFDDDTFICSEDGGNLISCHKDSGSTKEHERNVLKELGLCHLGENINVFRHGT